MSQLQRIVVVASVLTALAIGFFAGVMSDQQRTTKKQDRLPQAPYNKTTIYAPWI